MSMRLKFPVLVTVLAAISLNGCAKTMALTEEAPPTRNVILFVGDGMGISTLTAIRILAGQIEGKSGEEHRLPWDDYPHMALIKTYNTNQQVPDSAGTGTAILTGEKTKSGVISMNAMTRPGDCAGSRGTELETLLERAEIAGLATGIVTTTRLTHATPATTYAHTPHRDWESDADMPEAAHAAGCRDIARQFVEFNKGDGIDVAFGGGREQFLPEGTPDPEYADKQGKRRDGRNLLAEWQQKYPQGSFVTNSAEFDAIDFQKTGPVLGLFEPSHMRYAADRARDKAGEPSLKSMTETAIKLLIRKNMAQKNLVQKNLVQKNKGYFLIVEAGRIDHAHHAGNAYNALHDGVELARAVAAADAMTDDQNTLILVTADHSHTFSISGYPKRGNPILGKVVSSDDYKRTVKGADREFALAGDGKTYATLGYYTGPGASKTDARKDLAEVDTTAEDFTQQAVVYSYSGAHGGEDVAAFAKGPNAAALRGVMEQNLLHDVMAQVLNLPAR